jgi:ABC-type antimicrobial peptide transport system permease subunit
MQIVGVVGAVKQDGLAAADAPIIYLPFAQWPADQQAIAVRTSAAKPYDTGIIERAVRSIDRGIAVADVETMTDRMSQTIGMLRFAGFLTTLFALIGLALTVVGIYSVLSFVVGQRRREIAVRITLGATHQEIITGVVRDGVRLVAAGAVCGLGAAWVLARVLASVLVGVSPHDPVAFVVAALGIVALGVTAALIPARRASRIDPASTLKSS